MSQRQQQVLEAGGGADVFQRQFGAGMAFLEGLDEPGASSSPKVSEPRISSVSPARALASAIGGPRIIRFKPCLMHAAFGLE